LTKPSSSTVFYRRIKAFELNASVSSGETPVDSRSRSVAAVLPSCDLLRQALFVRDASVQALSMQDTEFDFSHIEPTAMLGGVMDFQFGGNAAGLGRRKGFIERSKFVRVQIVHHQGDGVCLREMDIDQVAHAVGKIDHGAALCHLDMAPSLQRRKAEKVEDFQHGLKGSGEYVEEVDARTHNNAGEIESFNL